MVPNGGASHAEHMADTATMRVIGQDVYDSPEFEEVSRPVNTPVNTATSVRRRTLAAAITAVALTAAAAPSRTPGHGRAAGIPIAGYGEGARLGYQKAVVDLFRVRGGMSRVPSTATATAM